MSVLHLIDIRNIIVEDVTIHFGVLLKQSKPGQHLAPIELVRDKEEKINLNV